MARTGTANMSPADQRGFVSPLAVAVVVAAAALSFPLAGARVMNRGDLIGRRGIAGAGAGACALAVAPLGYACEEHEVFLKSIYLEFLT